MLTPFSEWTDSEGHEVTFFCVAQSTEGEDSVAVFFDRGRVLYRRIELFIQEYTPKGEHK